MSTSHIIPPDLFTILEDLKGDVFSSLNCVQIGQIDSFDKTTQTASIKIQVKKQMQDNTLQTYPLLVDCPCFILQGGGAFIEMPIKKDDYCIILFNDRAIDNWYSTANIKEPHSTRKHSLSDGIALIGINPSCNVLNLVGSIVKIFTKDNPFKLDSGSAKQTFNTTGIIEMTNASNINLLGATQSYVKGDLTNSQFEILMTAIKTHTHSYAGMPSGTGETAVPTNAGSMSNPISLSSKIKGE